MLDLEDVQAASGAVVMNCQNSMSAKSKVPWLVKYKGNLIQKEAVIDLHFTVRARSENKLSYR